MPGYGVPKSSKGLLPWKWAQDRLVKSRQYWIATTRPDGSPHVMPVWGLWLDSVFYFSVHQYPFYQHFMPVPPEADAPLPAQPVSPLMERVKDTGRTIKHGLIRLTTLGRKAS